MAESGVKGTLSAVHSGIFGEIRSISGIKKRKAQGVCHMVAEKTTIRNFRIVQKMDEIATIKKNLKVRIHQQ